MKELIDLLDALILRAREDRGNAGQDRRSGPGYWDGKIQGLELAREKAAMLDRKALDREAKDYWAEPPRPIATRSLGDAGDGRPGE